MSITSAQPARSVDLHDRQVRYLISMGIRTVCFIGAVIADGPLRWVLVVGAVFLPYVAVIFANTANRRKIVDAERAEIRPYGELGDGTGR